MSEAPKHPHNLARGTFAARDDVVQPAPAPRFAATSTQLGLGPPVVGEHTGAILAELGMSADEVRRLHESRCCGFVRTSTLIPGIVFLAPAAPEMALWPVFRSRLW
jgi:hypothetical protein